MKLLKTETHCVVLDEEETFYSDNLRITIDKKATEFVFPKMTLMQSKLLMFLMAQVKSSENDIPRMVCSCRMLAEKILKCKVSDIPKFYDNDFFKLAISANGKIYEVDDEGNSVKKGTVTYFSMFDHFEISMVGNEPYIAFEFSKTMKQVLLHGISNFAEINTEYIYKFKSVYSIWLYFFLCGKVYHGRNWKFSFPLDHLTGILGVPQLADNYKEFNRSVLKPAEEEVTEKSDIQVKHSKKRGEKLVDFDCHRERRIQFDREKK